MGSPSALVQARVPHMNTTRRRLLMAALMVLLGLSAWLLWPRPAPPLFHGKPESSWIKEIGIGEQTQQWRSFGQDGIDVLVRGLEKGHRPAERLYRKAYYRVARRLPFRLGRFLPLPADPRWENRWSLVIQLGKMGEKARPAMTRALSDEDAFVRDLSIRFFTGGISGSREGYGLLGHLDDREKRALLPSFLRAMNDKDDRPRSQAAIALAYYPQQAEVVVPALVKALQDSYSEARISAAVALNRLDPATAKKAGAVSAIIPLLNDPSDQVVCRAAEALCEFKGQPELAVPALIGALQGTSTEVACTAVSSLEHGFPSQAEMIIPALQRAAQRKDNTASYAAAALNPNAEVKKRVALRKGLWA